MIIFTDINQTHHIDENDTKTIKQSRQAHDLKTTLYQRRRVDVDPTVFRRHVPAGMLQNEHEQSIVL